MNKNNLLNQFLSGSGGGKKQRTPKDSPNSLQSRATIKTVEVISEGEIKGIVGDLKGVYFDDTPVQNIDGSYNFPAIKYEARKGTPDQTYMPGFPAVESAVVVNTEVKYAIPVVRSVTSANVDAARIIVRLPQGLQYVDKDNGDQLGYRVGIAIDTRPTGGTWSQVFTNTITGKTTTSYEEGYRIEKPTGISTTWEIRVRRTNQESSSNSTVDRVDWFTLTEIQDIKVAYENAAVVGIALDSESTGGQVPRRSYLTDGIICKVPTNYTPTVYASDGSVSSYASYSGTWSGGFKYAWCDDPAWIAYDLLTNTRYGAGNEIDPNDIDIYSFYAASQYNCELIPNGSGGYEPRYRCNFAITTREDLFKVVNAILSNCRAYLWGGPGYIAIVQDRPQSPRKRINNAQVVDGIFAYTGTELSTRVTAVDVTFNDRLDRYQPRTITEQAPSSEINTYGYRKIEIDAIGIVDEAQARRLAKWTWDSTLTATEIVNFQVSWQNADIEMGEVVEIYDNFYIGAQVSGQVSGVTAISPTQYNVTLDRMLFQVGTSTPITNGQTMKIVKLDGLEVTGTLSGVTTHNDDPIGGKGYVTATWTVTSGSITDIEVLDAPFVILSAISPRQFRVSKIEHASEGVYSITAILHDPTKYARVESGIYIPPPVFSVFSANAIAAPTNVTINAESYFTYDGSVKYRLRFNWDKVVDKYLAGYRVRWRRENNQYQWSDLIKQNEFLLNDALFGIYEYTVFAYNTKNIQSPPTSGFYTFTSLDGQPSPIGAPTDVQIVGGGSTFTGTEFNLEWTAPDFTIEAVLKKYKVSVRDELDMITYADFYTESTETNITITRDMLARAAGYIPRTMVIKVRAVDTLDRLSNAGFNSISNEAPPKLTSITTVANTDFYIINHEDYTATPDAVGVVVHHSTSTGFAPSRSNLVLEDVGTTHVVPASQETTYYVRIAVADTWSPDDLNYSDEFMVTTTEDVVGVIPNAPTGLVATSEIQTSSTGVETALVTVTWNKSTSATTQYDLEITNITVPSYQIVVVSQPLTGSTVSYSFSASPGHNYKFRVRSRGAANISEWTEYTLLTTAADSTGPVAATGLTLIPAFSSMVVQWTNPPDNDLVSVEVWRRVGSSGTGSLITTVASPLTFFYDAGLNIGTAYSYRLRGIDRSGNYGTYTAWTSATNVANVPTGTVINNGQLANGAVGTVNIQNGAITATQIAANTITGNLIAANTIVGNNIAANTITAAQIASNTITANEIQTGSITSELLQADSVKAIHIDAGAVTADSVATNQIITSSANIADAVITNAKITGVLQSSNYVANSQGWMINKATGSAEFQDVLVRGEVGSSLIKTSVLSLESARLMTSANRLAPFILYDMGYASNTSGTSSFTVTLPTFVSPSNGPEFEYNARRFARAKMDVFLNADVDGDFGYETVYIEVQYDGGTWTTIQSLRTQCNYRGGMSLSIRYTTTDTAWSTVAFRARTAEAHTQVLNFAVQVYNFNESGNVGGSNSGTNSTGGGGGIPPDPEPWCVDLDMYMVDGLRAGQVAFGDWIAVYNNNPDEPDFEMVNVQTNRIGKAECLRMVTSSGASVIASESTPMTLRDHSIVKLPEMLGKDALVYRNGTFAWEEVVSLEPVGERRVAKISVHNQCYFSGENKDAFIATHNIRYKEDIP